MSKRKGFTKTEAENHPDYSKEQKEALSVLNELLAELNAKDYRKLTSEIFYSFLHTEAADYKPTREAMVSLHFNLINFFTKLHNLPLIDRFRNSV